MHVFHDLARMGINPGSHFRAEIFNFFGNVLRVAVLFVEELLRGLVHASSRIINFLGKVCDLLPTGHAFLLKLLTDVRGDGLQLFLCRFVLQLRFMKLLADLVGNLAGIFMYSGFKFLDALVDKMDVSANENFTYSFDLFSWIDRFFWIHGLYSNKGDLRGTQDELVGGLRGVIKIITAHITDNKHEAFIC